MLKNFIICIILSLVSTKFYAQETNNPISEKKVLQTKKKTASITIDGLLTEADWLNAEKASNFIMFEPDNGKPELENLKSEVKVIYDDDAMYVSAILYDDEPDKILKEITERDDDGVSDFFAIFLNGYNDGQQDFRFFVTAAGGQLDCNATDANGEDFSWNAIWDSAVKITDKGWQVEMKIPYAAIRFPKAEIQTWGVNFARQIRRYRRLYTWNPISNTAGTAFQQAGVLKGIENIETPTRLFLIPYSSFYLNSFGKEKANGTLKGGLDLKYGINDAFTLDAVLIPDFGQTKFDNQILNLGPFEQIFNENRPFFTEGTDLFSKGNLFYSRRIGSSPSTYPNVSTDEEVIEYPGTVQLVNALKVSGRTKKGLGIGFLNSVTKKTDVEIVNTITNERRIETVEPLANYNVFVLDQRFNKNSSVSLINTNVTRNGSFRDANVTATTFDLNTKENTYNASGAIKYSTINERLTDKNKNGFATELGLAETTGKIRYSVGGEYVSKEYDNNDLGINFRTNYYSLSGNVNYRLLKSTEKLNGFRLNLNSYAEFNNQSHELQNQNFNVNFNFQTKKNHAAGMNFNVRAFDVYDYYDPRVEGKFVIFPKSYSVSGFISTNYNNKFAFDINPFIGTASVKNWWFYGLDISPRYRFSNKFTVIYRNSLNKEFNDLGWVAFNGSDIVYAKRDKFTFETSIQSKYSIGPTMNFGLNLRHYSSFAENNSFYKLLDNGKVEDYTYTENRNSSFNAWNLDLSYSWWFAPGSQITALYRSNSSVFTRDIEKNLTTNIKNNFNHEILNNTFSVSIRYFIDYNQAKNWM